MCILIITLVMNFVLLIFFAKAKSLFVKSGINKCSKQQVGKVIIVTGADSGIGYETAKDLADRGARVILACRDEEPGIEAQNSIISATGNKNVQYRPLDFRSLISVKKFCDDIIKSEKQLDVLVNNAGVLEAKNVKSEDGLSLGMQINYFGPFLLTNLLLPLLKSSAPSRIVNVSSMAYSYGKIDFDNLNFDNDIQSFNFFKMYSNSKLCITLMTVELARLLAGTKVTVNCLHPGAVRTSIHNGLEKDKPWLKVAKVISLIVKVKTPWEGAQTTIYLAVSPEVSAVSGRYFSDCVEHNLTEKAKNAEVAKRLREVSEKLVKLI